MSTTISTEVTLSEKIETEVEIYPAEVIHLGYPFVGVMDDVINGNALTVVDLPI